jgi:hypothetical protein
MLSEQEKFAQGMDDDLALFIRDKYGGNLREVRSTA